MPNLAYVFDYFRASWTLRADLISDFVCRLLAHMDARGASMVTAELRDEEADMPLGPWVDPANFNPGYLTRSMHLMPRQGDREPWRMFHDYSVERELLAHLSHPLGSVCAVISRPSSTPLAAPATTVTAGMGLTVVDLFAGAGGISEGFRQAGYTVVAGADMDPDAAATYRINFPEAETLCGDLRDPAVLERVVAAAAGASVLVGGPPCQAYSQVRNHSRLIDDPRNSLYREFIAVLSAALPQAFLVENVPGMDQMGVRAQVAADLGLDGEYDVLPQVLNAADFGVPQTRNRLVFVGVRRAVGAAPLVEGTGATSALALARRSGRSVRYEIDAVTEVGREMAAVLAAPNDLRAVTAAQAIGDLAGLRLGNRLDDLPYDRLAEPASAYQRLMRQDSGGAATNVQVPRMNADTRLRLRRVPPGGNHLDIPDSLRDRYLSGQRWGPDAGTGRLARRHYYAYRRLHPGIWAWTLNTKADAVYHYATPRALSVREFARLHSFPDRFRFTTDPTPGDLPGRIKGGPAHSRYRQVGNAVPPLLAAAVAEALAKSLSRAA